MWLPEDTEKKAASDSAERTMQRLRTASKIYREACREGLFGILENDNQEQTIIEIARML